MRLERIVMGFFVWMAILAGIPPCSFAQEKKPGLEHQISVSAIAISVTVQDKSGKYINDLPRRISPSMRTTPSRASPISSMISTPRSA